MDFTASRRAGVRRLAAAAVAAAAALAVGTPAIAAGSHGGTAGEGPVGGYVVRAVPGALSSVLHRVHAIGGQVTREFRTIDGAAVRLSTGDAALLRQDPAVANLTRDAKVTLLTDSTSTVSSSYDPTTDPYSLENLEKAIGAQQAWATTTGQGIDVALIDSGVDPVQGMNDPHKLIYGPDLSFESQYPEVRDLDTFGHGTHMAGIIAGYDPADTSTATIDTTTNTDSRFMGVAPGARLVSIKVADKNGATDVSQVIAAIDWVVQHAHDPGYNIRVINLSFGTNSTQSYLLDPLAYAAEAAWHHGVVVVASAGNSGGSWGHLADPAIDPFVIAVGADDTNGTVDPSDDTAPSFTSLGDGTRNPDLVAPGAHVQSLRAPGSTADTEHSDTGLISDRFFRGSGTSQAAAVVSGAAALILQAHPNYTPDQVKYALVEGAVQLPNMNALGQGGGLLNVPAALSAPMTGFLPQSFAESSGLGTLQGARGDNQLSINGVVLQGEQDIFGKKFDAAAIATAEANGSTWADSQWNGSTWAGSTWAGSTWAGSTWAGSTWDGSTWAGSTWDGSTWAGSTWAGSTWAGSTWAGSTWAGSTWAGSTWADSDWLGHTWT